MRTYPEEDGLHLATVFALQVCLSSVQDLSGGYPVEGHSLFITDHPQENIRKGVLRLNHQKYIELSIKEIKLSPYE